MVILKENPFIYIYIKEKMQICKNAKMQKCKNAKMQNCKNAKI